MSFLQKLASVIPESMWTNNGNGIYIIDIFKFENDILKKNFCCYNYHLMNNELLLYGFTRRFEKIGVVYEHRFFVRDKPEVMNRIRKKVYSRKSFVSKQKYINRKIHNLSPNVRGQKMKIEFLLNPF